MFLPSIRKEKNQVTFIASFIVSSSLVAITSLCTKAKAELFSKLQLNYPTLVHSNFPVFSLVFNIPATSENSLLPIKFKVSLCKTDTEL